jgi:hypothetical protein
MSLLSLELKNAIWVAVGAIAARQLSSVLVLELCSAGILFQCVLVWYLTLAFSELFRFFGGPFHSKME